MVYICVCRHWHGRPPSDRTHSGNCRLSSLEGHQMFWRWTALHQCSAAWRTWKHTARWQGQFSYRPSKLAINALARHTLYLRAPPHHRVPSKRVWSMGSSAEIRKDTLCTMPSPRPANDRQLDVILIHFDSRARRCQQAHYRRPCKCCAFHYAVLRETYADGCQVMPSWI